MDIVGARAYIARGQIEVAMAYAESALSVAHKINSCRHFTRIANMYNDLKQNRVFQTSPDVARLGLQLLKIRLPDLFLGEGV